jgi:hypothetical protein
VRSSHCSESRDVPGCPSRLVGQHSRRYGARVPGEGCSRRTISLGARVQCSSVGLAVAQLLVHVTGQRGSTTQGLRGVRRVRVARTVARARSRCYDCYDETVVALLLGQPVTTMTRAITASHVDYILFGAIYHTRYVKGVGEREGQVRKGRAARRSRLRAGNEKHVCSPRGLAW